MHTAQEIGIDDFQASRSPDKRFYRTTPLRGLFVRKKGGFYHDGRFATLEDVVSHYSGTFKLQLSEVERKDLIEYLKSRHPKWDIPPGILPVAGSVSRRVGDETLALIEADGFEIHSGLLGESAYAQSPHVHPPHRSNIHPVLRYGVKGMSLLIPGLAKDGPLPCGLHGE
jgi:hypothetical protein